MDPFPWWVLYLEPPLHVTFMISQVAVLLNINEYIYYININLYIYIHHSWASAASNTHKGT